MVVSILMITNDIIIKILIQYLVHSFHLALIVATLALGFRPKQGLVRVRAKREAKESHIMLPGMYKSVRE
jgi:hypothetical protein